MGLTKPLVSDERPLVNFNPGDHIYSGRKGHLYTHHGIFVGNDSVIHLQGPRKDDFFSSPCEKCGYMPKREGGVVKTCVNCFLGGQSVYVREYGIRVSGNAMDDWVLEKLNCTGIVYTYRNGFVLPGIWVPDNNMVLHLEGRRLYVGDSPRCEKCGYKPDKKGGFVETCLDCFLRGNLLYISEHGVHAPGSTIGDWIPQKFKLKRIISTCPQILQTYLMLLSFASPTPFAFLYLKTFVVLLTGGVNVKNLWKKLNDIIVEEVLKNVPTNIKKFWNEVHIKDFGKKKIDADSVRSYMTYEDPFIICDDGGVQVCKLACAKSPDQVINTANELLREGFGKYNLVRNNCEHFATYCKTDAAISIQVKGISMRPFEQLTKLYVRFLKESIYGAKK